MIAVLDGKNETCIPLPVQGQSPPILWIRLNTSTVWELGLSAFQFSVLGHGLICSMQNHDTVMKVYKLFDFRKSWVICHFFYLRNYEYGITLELVFELQRRSYVNGPRLKEDSFNDILK